MDADGSVELLALEDRSPRQPDNLTHAFLKLAQRAGISLTFHKLCHSHASQLLMAGVPI